MAQISITITIDDNSVTDVLNKLAEAYNYPTTVFDVDGVTRIPNPQSKQNFIKAYLVKKVKLDYVKQKKADDAAAAAAAAETAANSVNIS